jgi:O-antigen/teichoic acid export membrane protein
LSDIKKLGGQTLWYGVPTIINRFLGYLMNLSLPALFVNPGDTADLTQVYAIIPFLSIFYTYGLETAYFRFSKEIEKTKLYNTLLSFILASTLVFSILFVFLKSPIVHLATLNEHSEYYTMMLVILILDTLATLPFAKLRQENKPKKYAFIRMIGVFVNVFIVFFFLKIIPSIVSANPTSFFAKIYNPTMGIGYFLVGNIVGSAVTMLLLISEFKGLRFNFDKVIWRKVIKYTLPLIIVGMGGMVNDIMSRLIYQHVVNLPEAEAKEQLGVFANIFRLALLITIMIQAFRMAAEPFFFAKSDEKNAKHTYARVMKFFVIACCFMFLGIALFIDVIEWVFIHFNREKWIEGLNVVPLLALGNIFLGIYYNLSIWYKLTDNNKKGAMITLVGALITIVLNILLIPKIQYTGAAIATFTCYLTMMVISYKMGQKYYPIPYARKKLIAYLVVVVLLYLIHLLFTYFIHSLLFSVLFGFVLIAAFCWLIVNVERKELAKIPYINKFVKNG